MKGDEWKHVDRPAKRIVQGHVMSDKVFRWLGERLHDRVHAAKGWAGKTWPVELRPHIIRWYQDNRLLFVDWSAWDECANSNRSTGRWIFCEQDFLDKWAEAEREARMRRRDADAAEVAQSFSSLDAWLAADLRKKIPVSVRGGSRYLPEPLKERISIAAEKRRDHWARNCTACGESFSPVRATLKRCDMCRASTKKIAPPTRRVIRPPEPQKLLPPLPKTALTQHPDFIKGYQESMNNMLQRLQASIDSMGDATS